METTMIRRLLRRFLLAAIACGIGAVTWGDHVLLQDGRMLFNVHVVDTNTTEARPLRIIYKPASFGYDYDRNTVFSLTGISGQFRVADFVTTSVEIGKTKGRELASGKKWHRYVEPPREILRPPTPAPTVVMTPVPKATPLPVNVASADLPLEERLQKQLDIFMQEQQQLSRDIVSSVTQRALTEESATQLRLQWLQAQKQVLETYYPKDAEIVRDAREQWTLQMQRVQGLGKFSFED